MIDYNNEYDVELVIPLGNGDPSLNVPKPDVLEDRLNRIAEIDNVKLTCVVDNNFEKSKLKIVQRYAQKIIYWHNDCFWRDGSGIWGKIVYAWLLSDCKYVAWQGYDDYSEPDRFDKQVELLEETGANSCFSSCWIDDGDNTWQENNGHLDWLRVLGNHAVSMHGFLWRKDAILNSGITDHFALWSWYFEGLLYTYTIKTGIPVVADTKHYRYEHPGTITKTWMNDWTTQQIEKYGYTPDDRLADFESINHDAIINEVRGMYK